MSTETENRSAKILLLATLSGGYRGADMVGQGHMDYPPNTYILPVMSAAIFPPKFYIDAFNKGFDAITVMYSGTDSPYKGESEKTAEIINETYGKMKELNLDPRRLRLAAICTVCVRPFLEEVQRAEKLLEEIGSVPRPLTKPQAVPAQPAGTQGGIFHAN
ncbi:MAG: hydrogenase iron-sulfur subunit [Anaerolineaceae bacterium]|jgi:coenzyme F420-reducing hydrogenase delta subunit|nr:MAG: hydrogenase iron-sulfur subunit [Anaerolineaceae bacterium]